MEPFDLTEYLKLLSFWHWLIAGLGFVILEMILPGVIFLWLGIAATLTGFILFFMPGISWEVQMLTFAVLSVVCSIAGRMWVSTRQDVSDHPHLNKRGSQYVGRQFKLTEPIENGIGKLIVDDTSWRISGEDMPAGSTVEVSEFDSVVLKVVRHKG